MYEIPRVEIADKLKRMYNFNGIVNLDKNHILSALIKYEESNVDIQDCLLAAYSAPKKVVLSFDKDMKKLNAFYEKP